MTKDKYYITKENYQRILNNVINQAPMECGVQALVFTFLDEIINKKYVKDDVKVLLADLRNKKSIFGGRGGVVDLCIVDNEFVYTGIPEEGNEEHNKFFAEQEKHRLGCVEIKAAGEALPTKIAQLAGHIYQYKKVIYTNGIVWMYFEVNNIEKCNEECIFSFLSKKERGWYKLKRTILNFERGQEIINIQEEYLHGWIIPLVFETNKGVLSAVCTNDVTIDKDNFEQLREKISKIKWK